MVMLCFAAAGELVRGNDYVVATASAFFLFSLCVYLLAIRNNYSRFAIITAVIIPGLIQFIGKGRTEVETFHLVLWGAMLVYLIYYLFIGKDVAKYLSS